MDYKDRIRMFQAYALTNSVGLYNEDSMTAQKLMIQSSKKIKECLEMVSTLTEAIENIKAYIGLNIDGENEEIQVTVETKITEIKTQVNNSYVCMYNEDALTSGELAGRTAQATNECLKAVNMLCDLVLDINTIISLNYDPDNEMLNLGGDNNE